MKAAKAAKAMKAMKAIKAMKQVRSMKAAKAKKAMKKAIYLRMPLPRGQGVFGQLAETTLPEMLAGYWLLETRSLIWRRMDEAATVRAGRVIAREFQV